METAYSPTSNKDLSASLALLIGLFLATAGNLKLILGRWWASSSSSNTSPPLSPKDPKASAQLPTSILNITSVIEVIAGIALLYPPLRLLAAVVLLCMIAFLEFENQRRGVEKLAWMMRSLAVVVTVGLVVIVGLEVGGGRVWLGWRKLWEGSGSWEMKRWAGLEGREVGFDF